ncbi:unnamed protein product [Haemonchus placei]|uniref:Uncharacterized protein n=1 Tax=Haemonchus placei TaxID=6290 RepID=A0A3P7TBI1_HAEPC|nr:unnamed protein product [Haemonchus placei]
MIHVLNCFVHIFEDNGRFPSGSICTECRAAIEFPNGLARRLGDVLCFRRSRNSLLRPLLLFSLLRPLLLFIAHFRSAPICHIRRLFLFLFEVHTILSSLLQNLWCSVIN